MNTTIRQYLTYSFIFIAFFNSYSQSCFTKETLRFKFESQTYKSETISWLKDATQANYAYAAHDLGLIYVRGRKVSRNYDKAYSYFEKAALLGLHNSMRSLGIMWKNGEGRAVNLAKAYGWYRLAGEYIPTSWSTWSIPRAKIAMFKRMASELAENMTPEELKEGEKYYKKMKARIQCDFLTWVTDQNP